MPIDLNVMLARTALSGNSVWTKICGLTDVANAKEVAHLNPDAIGLNFYSKSSRHIDDATAEAIASEIPKTVAIVGVFVNEPPHEIARRARLMRLSAIQFHGDERPEHVGEVHAELPDASLIRAWRRGPHGLKPIVDDLQRYQELQIPLAACLLDPAVGKEYGGTGQTLPWQTLRQELDETSLPPLILAGGLHPANIAEAIAAVRPFGVDVASGVEVRPGIKDLEKVHQFLLAIRKCGPVKDRPENGCVANG